jgi:hypothetical protein
VSGLRRGGERTVKPFGAALLLLAVLVLAIPMALSAWLVV